MTRNTLPKEPGTERYSAQSPDLPMLMKIIIVIHKRWAIKVALADFTELRLAPPLHTAFLQYGTMTICMRTVLWVYPLCFFFLLYLYIPLMNSSVVLEDVLLLGCFFALLAWSLFLYLTMLFWLWYKNKCRKMHNRNEKMRVRMWMKKMLKWSPYYVSTHVFFCVLVNVIIFLDAPYLIGVSPGFAFLDFMLMFFIYRSWIRMAAYPLRTETDSRLKAAGSCVVG